MTVVAGCSAPAPTPGRSDSAPQSAAANPSDEAGFLTDPPNPRDLQPSLATSSAVSAEIGWEGGAIEASGPAGATYRLEIPPEALAVLTTITLTPLNELTGFGSLDGSLEHMLGVELEPEGLQLVVPATLTMTPAVALPPAGIATGDYLGHGEDAAVLLADTTETTITFEISHFSGYWSVWPLEMEDWRVFANDKQRDMERFLRSEIAQLVGLYKERQERGLPVVSLQELARNIMEGYDVEEVLLDGRLALAGNGCFEAQAAIQAFLTWEQQLQFMGIADDEELYAEFGRPIPSSLFDLVWNLCLDEEYQRCAAIGEWPRLATFLLGQVRQRAIWDFPLTAAQTQEGTDRLVRCGRWRVELTTTLDLLQTPQRAAQEFASEILVRFRADGDLPFGLSSTDVGYGFAEVEVSKLDLTQSGQHATLRNIQTSKRAQARITGMTFVTPIDGSEPIALSLKLDVDPGEISFEALDHFFYAGEYLPQTSNWYVGSQGIFGVYPPTIAAGWGFEAAPYRAEFARTCPARQLGGVTVMCDIEVIVEHTPD
ncbi:MAG: hypothetical protein M3P32_06105 [Chloroflexota bacterium]|nr:hypothetical protein [Chloroflexota bacterium]